MALPREIMGFYTNWMPADTYLFLNYDVLSTIAYFDLVLLSDGSLLKPSNYPPTNMIDYAHSKGVKVVLTFHTDWALPAADKMLADPISQNAIITNLLNEVKANNFDGIDLDVEGLPAINTVNGQSNRNLFTNFVANLSSAFLTYNPGYRISIDVPSNDWSNIFDCTNLQKYVTYIMIMGYDYHWKNSITAGAVAPLNSANKTSVTDTVNYYLSITSKDKLLLGVPYYGYEWNTQTNTIDSPTTSASTTVRYNAVIDTKLTTYQRQWYNLWATPYYMYPSGSQWVQGWYDDSQSLGMKYDLVNSKGLAGIGIWALGYDLPHTELTDLIINKFSTTTPPQQPGTGILTPTNLLIGIGALGIAYIISR